MTWFRVFFANGKSKAVEGEDARDRAVARTSPRVILVEQAIIHKCRACPAEGPWREGWIAYSSDVRRRFDNRDLVFCSRECWVRETGGFDLPAWLRVDEEPRDRERQQALYLALRDERARKSDMAARRKVPMVEWKGQGFCKWCNGAMTKADGRALYWHPGCVEQYLLHSRPEAQFSFLVKRDGRTCAVDGCEARGQEVDHRTPLWSIWDLPDEERRPYYGPDNLQLLCGPCHKAKCAQEARERADRRRGLETGPEQC